jgi:hypothetical protein
MSVVPFPSRKEEMRTIFVCNCGCASFELNGDGTATCRSCRAIPQDGGWKVRGPDDPKFEGDISFSDAGNGGDFAERKIKRDAQKADWIIAGTYEGRIMSWCEGFIETPEQEEWLRRGVGIGLDEILKDKP